MFFFDGKELFIHKKCDKFIPHIESKDSMQILVREWSQDTWQLSEIKLVEFPKKAKMHDFANYLHQMFPHIPH
jgi:hypothetical protein